MQTLRLAISLLLLVVTAQFADTEVDFLTQVRPILVSSCYACHNGNEVKAGLRLDIKALALKGGVSGAAIIPGNGNGSLLLHRVLGDNGKPRMPMGGTPLTSDQIATLSRWVDQGAKWPES